MSDITKPNNPLTGIEKSEAAEERFNPQEPARTQEKIITPETGGRIEGGPVMKEKNIVRAKEQMSNAPIPAATPPVDYFGQQHQARLKEVENILAEDLDDIYVKLDPNTRAKFKDEGEKTAIEINNMLDQAKFKAKEVIALIKKWLFMIPGINRFFLEQEVKIKTDKIVQLRHEKLGRQD